MDDENLDENLASVLGQDLNNVIDSSSAATAGGATGVVPILRFSANKGMKGKGKGKKGKGHFGGKAPDDPALTRVGKNYICQNCGMKGDHWLQDCPQKPQNQPENAANQEKETVDYETWVAEADKKKAGSKIRWARGIPMSYLMECPTYEAACQRSVDGACYLRREKPGKYFAFIHDAGTRDHIEKMGGGLQDKVLFAYGAGLNADAYSHLCCEICSSLFQDPETVPCCGSSFCRDCIAEKLFNNDKCPHCKKPRLLSHMLRPHPFLQGVCETIRNADIKVRISLGVSLERNFGAVER